MFKHSIIFLIFLLSLPNITAQNKKPKVALVLSGGGAKGIAHIPTLQVLDSLGIVPDLIVGNSMGSVVGGLYAMGYSGNEIATLTLNANWGDLIGGNLSLNNVSNEEKSEYNNYLLSAVVLKNKIKINPFILSDQNLRTYLNSLTYPVYNVSNFDSLPIPYRAIATDIVAGKEVVLKSGSLALAMRSSMSIPAVFSAVPYKNTLLIDGGVLNNFPADVAKELGANFIIGSDVGNGMLPKERLDNLQSLLFQSGMIASNIKNPKNRALCSILLSHGPHITYATSDFAKGSNIYNEGKIALKEKLPQLIEISKTLKSFKQKEVRLPKLRDSIFLDTVVFNGISSDNINLIKARSKIKSKISYTEKGITKGINTAMGTALFRQVEYGLTDKNDTTELFINATEIADHQIKGAIHYDNDLGAGVILNYTGRNLIGASSRSLISLDLTKNPKIRLQHQNIFGKNKKWWLRTEFFANKYRQGLFYAGYKVDDIKYQFFHASSWFNRNLSPLKSHISLGVEYENSILKPTVPPEIESREEVSLNKYKYQTVFAAARFNYNSINSRFYATKGNSLNIAYKRSFNNKINIELFDTENVKRQGSLANHHKIIFEGTSRIPISSKLTAITGLTGAFIFEDALKNNELSFVENSIGIQYFLGGSTVLARSGSFLMSGLKEGEILASQFLKADVSLQYALQNKLYVMPHMSMAIFGVDSFSNYVKNFTQSTSDWDNVSQTGLTFSTGLTLSYDSILGPINIDASFVNGINKVRFFIGVGYSFVGL